jgi:hypothetical protein
MSMTPTGNRTRDLPGCRAVPQPTAPPCAPVYCGSIADIPGTNTSSFILGIFLIYKSFDIRNGEYCWLREIRLSHSGAAKVSVLLGRDTV